MPASLATHPATPPRDRSIEARRAARRAKFERERLIVDALNRGLSVAEIAQRIGVTEKRMRALVKEILARRMPQAPEDYAALQASRLNEALMVAYGAMSDKNLKAVALVVRIVRELDRYHGFVAAARGPRRDLRPTEAQADELPARACDSLLHQVGTVAGDPRTLIRGRRMGCEKQDCAAEGLLDRSCRPVSVEAAGRTPFGPSGHLPQKSRGRGAPNAIRPEMAPQGLEKIESAPEEVALPNAFEAAPLQAENARSLRADGVGVDASNGAPPPAAGRPDCGPAPAAPRAGAEMAPQAIENTDSAPGYGRTAGVEPELAPPPATPVERQPMEWAEPTSVVLAPDPSAPGGFRRMEIRYLRNGVAAYADAA